MRRDFITVVSGLPRSGTSLMMQMLAAGGISPLTDALRRADESNPRGYLEFEPVKRLRGDKTWLDSARGHAVKVIHLLLPELPHDGRFEYRVLLMKRAMDEVIASQAVMLARLGKTSADAGTLAKIYASQLSQAEQWLASHSCFAVQPVEHHRVLAEPRLVAVEINAFLGSDLDAAAMERAVDVSLYRQRGRTAVGSDDGAPRKID